MTERLLTIGTFARRSRLSLKALRLYERLGLLVPAAVDPINGYRGYRESQLFTARLIVGLRRLDMPLSAIAEVLSHPGETASGLVDDYWAGVERRVAAQRQLAALLRRGLVDTDADAEVDAFLVQEREVPAVIVLSEERTVDVLELPAIISSVLARLTARTPDHGGVAGGPMIFFHGAVNEDSAGPVEIGLPVRTAGAGARTEPAHREAYVTVTRAQWEWPQILSAYDAVENWVDGHGRTRIGSPRELYRAGLVVADAAASDEVCDVALPIE